MNRSKFALVIAALSCFQAVTPIQAATAPPRAYVKIESAKQGVFKGETVRIAGSGYIPVLRLTYENKSVVDPATGLTAGRRQHLPLIITKALDSSSPQILQAMGSNEVLTKVTIEFITTNTEGKELTYYMITLKNATISDLRLHMDQAEATPAGSSTVASDPMEDVSFTFQEMDVQSNVGQTTAADSWNTSNQ